MSSETLLLRLEGYEGPLDLLLELARAQKVDLGRISILDLVEQYLAIVEGAGHVRLELAADWLVMAAWLAWLKSRLLLPEDQSATEDGETAGRLLAGRLEALEAIRAAAVWLRERPRLGEAVHARGTPEDFIRVDRSTFAVDLGSLLRGYLSASRRARAGAVLQPKPVAFWTVGEARARLQRLLGELPPGSQLADYLPSAFPPGASADPLQRRAAVASTLLAGLELARSGALELEQEGAFAPIRISAAMAAREAA